MPLPVVHSVRSWLPQTMTWLYTQVHALPSGVEPHVVCDTTENLDQFEVLRLHAFDEVAPAWRYHLARVLRVLGLRQTLHGRLLTDVSRTTGARLVHSHFGFQGWKDMPAVRSAGIPHVVTFYGVDVDHLPRKEPRWKGRYRELFDAVALVLCEGGHMATRIEALGCPAEKVRVQHLGIPLDAIPYRPSPWQPGESLRVLIAASFREKKGIPYAIQALGQIQNRVPLDVTLIGDANEEPRNQKEKVRILEAIEQCGLRERVRLLGYQPYARLREEIYHHHVCLSPSVTAHSGDSEGGAPVTLIEMQAAGTFVISTTHCDIPEVVRHGETGLLAPERDVEGLVQHLLWLLDHPDAWRSMLDAGRRHVEKEYSAATQGETLARHYYEVAG